MNKSFRVILSLFFKKKKQPYRNQQNHALIELSATLLLLTLTVIFFAAISYFFLSTQDSVPGPIARITGRIVDNNLVLEHVGGESVSLNTTIAFSLGSTSVQIMAYDYVDSDAKKDGVWGFGEQVVYPMYTQPEYLEAPQIELHIINSEPASAIMFCSVVIDPLSDLSVEMTVDSNTPNMGTPITFTITLQNNGNINVSEIKIYFELPVGLTFTGYSATRGSYDNSTGIWRIIDPMQPGESAVLTVTAIVGRVTPDERTQILILIDGSGSIRKKDLDFIHTGFVTAVENESVFPQDGFVELTIVEFGGNPGFLNTKVVLSPTLVTNETIASVVSTLNSIDTMPGLATTSCGFLLGCDTITASSIFTPGNRHVVLLITDGKAELSCINDGDYLADPGCGVDPEEATLLARDYLIEEFGMNSMDDEIDVIAVHVTDDDSYTWFQDEIVWPQPGYFAPPFRFDLPLQGSVSNASDWAQFPFIIKSFLTNALNRFTMDVDIIQSSVTDPKALNNIDRVIIKPQSP